MSWWNDLRESLGLRAPYMPGEDEARDQYAWARKAMEDSAAFNRHAQFTPWGSVQWEGDQQHVALNPHDQRNLTEQRRLQTQMLRGARSLVNPMLAMAMMPFNERRLHDVRMPKFQRAPQARFNVDMPQFMAAHSGGLPQVGTSQFRNLNTMGLPTPSTSQFAEVNFQGLPGVHTGAFERLNLGGLPPMPRVGSPHQALAQAMMGMERQGDG